MGTSYPFWSEVKLTWPWTNILSYLSAVHTVELAFLLDHVFWSVWEHWFEVVCSWSRTKWSLLSWNRSPYGIQSIKLIALSNDTPEFRSFSGTHNLAASKVGNGVSLCWSLTWCLDGVIVIIHLHTSNSTLEPRFKRLIRFVSTISFLFHISYTRSHRPLSKSCIHFVINVCNIGYINSVLSFLLNHLDWIVVGPVLFGESSFILER